MTNATRRPPRLALLVPCFNEADTLPRTIPALREKLASLISAARCDPASFLVFVDDGSFDGTWARIETASRESHRQVVGIRLAVNCGHQNALVAAIDYATDRAEASVSIDADLQDELATLDDMLSAYMQGAELVLGVRRSRASDTAFKRWSAGFFYRLMRVMGVDATEQHADYRLMSSAAMRNLRQFPEYHLFLRGLIARLHNKVAIVEYDRLPRTAGETKYPLRKMMSLAVNGITSFSTVPLRAISIMGFVVFALGFSLATFAVVSWLLDATVPGWASITAPLYALGGVVMLSVGVVGEYVGKIYEQVKKRPRYLIDQIAGEP